MEYVKLVDVWKTYRTKAGSVTPLRGVNFPWTRVSWWSCWAPRARERLRF